MEKEFHVRKAAVCEGGAVDLDLRNKTELTDRSLGESKPIAAWDIVVTLGDVWSWGKWACDKTMVRVISFLPKKSGCDLGQLQVTRGK